MNKPIKLTSTIIDPNVLLNKFIIYEYLDGKISLCYIFKIDRTLLYVYDLYYDYKGKLTYFGIHDVLINTINIKINNIFKEHYYSCCVYIT